MKKIILGSLLLGLFFSACEKKAGPIDDFKVTVDFRSTGAKFLTGDVTLNPKDSIYFDFTITSPTDMSYIEIQKNGTRVDTFRLNSANNRSFSLVKGYRADSIPGDYSFRILARDARAIFMGDGGKMFKVTIRPDFIFWSARVLQVPDTVGKINRCYYSTTEGKTYSYSELTAATSNKIDFGYFFDTTRIMAGSPATLQPKGNTIYSLTNTVTPFLAYDISTWTKNLTTFKALSITFNAVTSGGAIRSNAVPALASGAVQRFSQTDRAAAQITNLLTGQVLAFKTVAGKYGILTVYYTNNDAGNRNSYINIDVKIEK